MRPAAVRLLCRRRVAPVAAGQVQSGHRARGGVVGGLEVAAAADTAASSTCCTFGAACARRFAHFTRLRFGQLEEAGLAAATAVDKWDPIGRAEGTAVDT
eukprot:7389472-Prymnesium_polylepis.2